MKNSLLHQLHQDLITFWEMRVFTIMCPRMIMQHLRMLVQLLNQQMAILFPLLFDTSPLLYVINPAQLHVVLPLSNSSIIANSSSNSHLYIRHGGI